MALTAEHLSKHRCFPKTAKVSLQKRMPDFDYIQKKLLRNGVNKKLLWTEYLEKRRATMHINHKFGEQIEADWAGYPAQIKDPDTGEIIPVWLFVRVLTYSHYPYVETFINEKQNAWITDQVAGSLTNSSNVR